MLDTDMEHLIFVATFFYQHKNVVNRSEKCLGNVSLHENIFEQNPIYLSIIKFDNFA